MHPVWLKQHAPKPHGCGPGGQGFGVQVSEATWVHPVGHDCCVSGWQMLETGSQQTTIGAQGFVGAQAVPTGSTVPPECTQKLGSLRTHLPQQQHAPVGWLHTGLGLHGVLARKVPPRPAQVDALVEAHPPGRQHEP
jgi:hypothetical protein